MKHIYKHKGHITRNDRIKLLQPNKVLWFTGLSGSGKSTLAYATEKKLYEKGILTFVLDGDNIRHDINKDLGFSLEDRKENIRRVAHLAKLFYESGIFVLVSFISPLREDRDFARKLIGDDFIEIFVSCSLEECMKRDVKGLYKKALNGEINHFTGIESPYEEPLNPEITIDTTQSLSVCVDQLCKRI